MLTGSPVVAQRLQVLTARHTSTQHSKHNRGRPSFASTLSGFGSFSQATRRERARAEKFRYTDRTLACGPLANTPHIRFDVYEGEEKERERARAPLSHIGAKQTLGKQTLFASLLAQFPVRGGITVKFKCSEYRGYFDQNILPCCGYRLCCASLQAISVIRIKITLCQTVPYATQLVPLRQGCIIVGPSTLRFRERFSFFS